MNVPRIAALAALSLHLGLTGAHAQFSSGSDGSDGVLNPPFGVDINLDVPPDGIFNFTTVTMNGGRVHFNRNALNTPVYVLATGDIVLQNGSFFDAAGGAGTGFIGGPGGPGGFDGGMPGLGGASPGAGLGPGAGRAGTCAAEAAGAGHGAYGGLPSVSRPLNGTLYGSALLIPLVGGSGGGGCTTHGGGGGGGAILISSSTRVSIDGQSNVRAGGGLGLNSNHGSGGAIRIVSPVVSGIGSLNADGTLNSVEKSGSGRIRVDLIDRSQFNLTMVAGSVSVGSFMTVFLPTVPRLDVIEAAGTAIPEGTASPVVVSLPLNSSPNRTVKVQARDFTGIVPIDVVLTPDSGDRIVVPAQIDMSTGNPAQVTVNVTLPLNTPTRISAWTRNAQ